MTLTLEQRLKCNQAATEWAAKYNNEFNLLNPNLAEKYKEDWENWDKTNDHCGIIHLDGNVNNSNSSNLEYLTESQYYILRELLSSTSWVAKCKASGDEWAQEQTNMMVQQDAYYHRLFSQEFNNINDYYVHLFSKMQASIQKKSFVDVWSRPKPKNKYKSFAAPKFADLVKQSRKKAKGFSK